jgi:predicted DCC family thiol-disulfide oxidoreductase YuxK
MLLRTIFVFTIILLHILVYDSDCGPCARFRYIVEFLDTRRRIDSVGLVQADKNGLLDSVPAARRHRSFHLIDPDGTVASGAGALAPLVGLLPAGRAFERIIRLSVPVSLATRIIYTTFSRLHDSGACTYPSRGTASTSISTSRKKKEALHSAIFRLSTASE